MKKINLILIFVSLISFVSAHAGENYYGMMGGMMNGVYGWGMGFFVWFFMILVFIVLILFIIWLIKQIEEMRRFKK